MASKVKTHGKSEQTNSYHGKRNGSGKTNFSNKSNEPRQNANVNKKDKSKLRCHKCQGYGHFRNEYTSEDTFDNSKTLNTITKNDEAFVCEALSCEYQD